MAEALRQTPEGSRLIVTEGPLKCQIANNRGVPAVATVTGANKKPGNIPSDENLKPLLDYVVVLWPDNDAIGRSHMQEIAERLLALGLPPERLYWVNWTEAPPKGDAADFFKHGHTVAELDDLIVSYEAYNSLNLHLASTQSTQKDEQDDQTDRGNAGKRVPPKGIRPAAFYGLAGDIVCAGEPHTEGDPIGILIQILMLFGLLFGRKVYFRAGNDKHHPNLYVTLVGRSGKGRKGSSWTVAIYPFTKIPELATWLEQHIGSGLSSGEGLIHALRDEDPPDKDGHKKAPEPLQEDKRILLREDEFALLLKTAARDGSIVSEVMRKGFDGGDLQTMNKNSPEKATGPFVCVWGYHAD